MQGQAAPRGALVRSECGHLAHAAPGKVLIQIIAADHYTLATHCPRRGGSFIIACCASTWTDVCSAPLIFASRHALITHTDGAPLNTAIDEKHKTGAAGQKDTESCGQRQQTAHRSGTACPAHSTQWRRGTHGKRPRTQRGYTQRLWQGWAGARNTRTVRCRHAYCQNGCCRHAHTATMPPQLAAKKTPTAAARSHRRRSHWATTLSGRTKRHTIMHTHGQGAPAIHCACGRQTGGHVVERRYTYMVVHIMGCSNRHRLGHKTAQRVHQQAPPTETHKAACVACT